MRQVVREGQQEYYELSIIVEVIPEVCERRVMREKIDPDSETQQCESEDQTPR